MEKLAKLGTKLVLALSLITETTSASLAETISKQDFIKQVNKLYNNHYKNFHNWDIAGKHFYLNKQKGTYYNLKILEKVLFYDIRLSYFLEKYPQFIKKTKSTTIIYIFRSKKLNNKFVYLLFRNGILQIAAYTSPGKLKYKTPLWKFKTHGKNINKRSKKYDNFPMPFAIHLDGGIFIHWGERANGYPASHGCFRLKGLASWMNFENIKNFEKIPVIFTGYKKSF